MERGGDGDCRGNGDREIKDSKRNVQKNERLLILYVSRHCVLLLNICLVLF